MVDQLAALLPLLSGGVATALCFSSRRKNTHFPNGRKDKVSLGSLCVGRRLVSGKEARVPEPLHLPSEAATSRKGNKRRSRTLGDSVVPGGVRWGSQ